MIDQQPGKASKNKRLESALDALVCFKPTGDWRGPARRRIEEIAEEYPRRLATETPRPKDVVADLLAVEEGAIASAAALKRLRDNAIAKELLLADPRAFPDHHYARPGKNDAPKAPFPSALRRSPEYVDLLWIALEREQRALSEARGRAAIRAEPAAIRFLIKDKRGERAGLLRTVEDKPTAKIMAQIARQASKRKKAIARGDFDAAGKAAVKEAEAHGRLGLWTQIEDSVVDVWEVMLGPTVARAEALAGMAKLAREAFARAQQAHGDPGGVRSPLERETPKRWLARQCWHLIVNAAGREGFERISRGGSSNVADFKFIIQNVGSCATGKTCAADDYADAAKHVAEWGLQYEKDVKAEGRDLFEAAPLSRR